jgi:hypothetical protein
MPEGRGPTSELSELISLLILYVKQQTLGPLKSVGRSLLFGTAAALMLGIGAVLLLTGLLRALQTETGTLFAGEWSWAPYLLTVVAALLGFGLLAAILLRAPKVPTGSGGPSAGDK